MVALTMLGAADMVSVYVRHLLVQLETPDHIRGRVSAVSAVFIGASNELGEFESGLMAKWWGAVRAVVIGGVATLLVTGLWTRMFPVLWRMQEFPQEEVIGIAAYASSILGLYPVASLSMPSPIRPAARNGRGAVSNPAGRFESHALGGGG